MHGWIWAYESEREVISTIPGLSRPRGPATGAGDGEEASPAAASPRSAAAAAAAARVRRVVHDVDADGRIRVCELFGDAPAPADDAGSERARGPDEGGSPSAEAPSLPPPPLLSSRVPVLVAVSARRRAGAEEEDGEMQAAAPAAGRPVSPCDGCSQEGRLRPPADGPCAL